MPSVAPSIYDIGKTIKSKLLKPAQTSIYEVHISLPTFNNNVSSFFNEINGRENSELIKLSCSDAALPGSTIATSESPDKFHGSTHRYGYRRIFDDRADFTFYVDAPTKSSPGYNIIWFFERWISYIVGEDSLTGRESENYSYRVNYPNRYRSNIYITKFEKDINLSSMNKSNEQNGGYLEYSFIQAFPTAISSMPVSYEQSQLLKCTVSFTYIRYVLNRRPGGARFVESSSIQSSAARNSETGSSFNIDGQIADFNPALPTSGLA